jgi:hypothetical protein
VLTLPGGLRLFCLLLALLSLLAALWRARRGRRDPTEWVLLAYVLLLLANTAPR